MKPPRSSTTAGTAVARIVESIATSPTLSITASRIGPRSLRSPTSARLIAGVASRRRPHLGANRPAAIVPGAASSVRRSCRRRTTGVRDPEPSGVSGPERPGTAGYPVCFDRSNRQPWPGELCFDRSNGDLAGARLPVGRDVRRERHQLRAVQRGRRAGATCACSTGRRRDPGRAHRGRRLRLARLPAAGAARPALRLPGHRPVGPRAGAALQPEQAAARPLRQGDLGRDRVEPEHCSATPSATRTSATTTTPART